MNIDKLIKKFEKELEEIKGYLVNRARKSGYTGDTDMIFSLEIEVDLATLYDTEDLMNHEYEMGKYVAYNEILRALKYAQKT